MHCIDEWHEIVYREFGIVKILYQCPFYPVGRLAVQLFYSGNRSVVVICRFVKRRDIDAVKVAYSLKKLILCAAFLFYESYLLEQFFSVSGHENIYKVRKRFRIEGTWSSCHDHGAAVIAFFS